MLRARWVALVAALAAAICAAPQLAQAETVLGQQHVLMVLATWGPQPYSVTDVKASARRADAFVRRASFGQASLDVRVTGWLNVLSEPVGCPKDWWEGIPTSITGPARSAATSAGVRFASYRHVVYLVPRTACAFRGAAWEPNVLLNGSIDSRVLVHELGHTWGLAHAHSTDTLTSHVTDEYGDIYDVMGDGATDFGVYEKTLLGWVRNVRVANGSGTYAIRRADRRGDLPAGLRIDRGDEHYWFEYRPQPLRWAGRTIPGGVLAHVVDQRDAAFPFDASPVLLLDPNHRGRPTLRPGERLRVPGAFTVRVRRSKATGAISLAVTFGAV